MREPIAAGRPPPRLLPGLLLRLPSLLLLAFTAPQAANAQAPLPHWTLREEIRIGSVEGREALTRVYGLAVSADGRTVYVGQPQERLVRAFDAATGRFIRTFGRDGSGPGEFRSLTDIGLRGDTIVVVDGVLQHASHFSPGGEHLRTQRLPPAAIPGSSSVASLSHFLSDGTGIGVPRWALGNPDAPPLPWVRMGPAGEYLGTLGELDRRNGSGTAQIGGRAMIFLQPMADQRSRLRVSPDGASIVLVHAPPSAQAEARFTVTRMAASADTLYHRSYRYTPRPIPPRLADSIYSLYSMGFESAPAALVREEIRKAVVLPPALPPVSDVVHASDGSTWLRREEGLGASARWLILAPDGGIRATAVTPVGLKVLLVEGEAVWGTIRDDLDVPYVVRYRRVAAPAN
jgi:hypothetical protein